MPQPINPIVRIAQSDVTTPNTGRPNKAEPKIPLTTIGWDKGQVVSGNHLNYIFNNMAEHIEWLNEQVDVLRDEYEKAKIKVNGIYIGGDDNPATHLNYGTWVKIVNDVVLVTGATDDYTVRGENLVNVPLPQHTHTGGVTSWGGEHDHSFSGNTNTAGQHHHSMAVKNYKHYTGLFGSSHNALAGGNDPNGGSWEVNLSGTSSTAGQHSHWFSGTTERFGGHHHNLTVDNAGVANPQIDVRGRYITVVMWRRTQ